MEWFKLKNLFCSDKEKVEKILHLNLSLYQFTELILEQRLGYVNLRKIKVQALLVSLSTSLFYRTNLPENIVAQ